jgi:hypothetical protein
MLSDADTQRGGKLTNTCTICDRNPVTSLPARRFLTTIGSLVRGSIAENSTPASNAEKPHVSNRNMKNNMAGSGRRLPARSIQSSERDSQVLPAAVVPVESVISILLVATMFASIRDTRAGVEP